MIRDVLRAFAAVCFILGLIGEIQMQEEIQLVREQRALNLENRNGK